MHIYCTTLIDVIPAQASYARRRQINSRTAHHTVLDRNVADMVVFNIRSRFDLDEPPSTVPAAMQNIEAHEHTAVLKGAFEDSGDFAVRG